MKIRITGSKEKLYLSIFISLILCIVITLLVVSAVLYFNFVTISLDQVYSDNMKNLTQTSQGIQNMANTAMTLSNQIYNDLSVAKLLYYSDPDIFDVRSANDQLTNYRLSLSFIDSVYVYNGKSGKVYISASSDRNTSRETIQSILGFDDKECKDILNHFKSFKQYIPIPRKFVVNPQEGIEKYYYTFLLYDAFTGKDLNSAVIVNISEDWIHKVISDDSDYSSSETFIINGNGVIVSNSSRYPMLKNISERSYIKKILQNTNTQGYFVDTVDGVKSVVTYTSPDEVGWRYIRITPWNVLFHRIETMRTQTIFIGLGILLFGLLIAFLVSKKLYVPIEKILSNLKNLEAERRKNIGLIKQELLKDIILGREIENKSGLMGRLGSMGIHFNTSGTFILALVKIDHYREFYSNQSPEDRRLLRFAIMNICTDIFSHDYKTEAVDMGEGTIAVLLNTDGLDVSDFPGAIGSQLSSVREAILYYLKISVSITVSNADSSLEGISTLYRQVSESSLHRLFYGHGSIIYSSKIEELSKKEYNYPMQKEKLLTDALLSFKDKEAKRIYDEIVYDAAEYPFSVINLVISRLIFTVNNSINIIKKNNSLLSDFDTKLPAMIINNAEVIEEINEVFYKTFDDLGKMLNEKRNTKYDELIANIDEKIQREYSNPSLSIDNIADSLGVSATYMCKLYKQHTMSTVLDKIVEVRMEKARELLLNTEQPVAEIAEGTGFTSNSYFYRAFKKYNGTTPSDFRHSALTTDKESSS